MSGDDEDRWVSWERDDGTTVSIDVKNGQQTITDDTSGTAATSPTYTTVYASHIDEPVVRDATGGLQYYHRGQQYSVTALTDSTGTIKEQYAYDAYGNLSIFDSSGTARTSSAEGNRYAYTGREYDDVLDLYHYRARMYDSIAGRFCSRDQIGYYDGMNLVQYGHGRPTIAVDYTGYEGVMTSDCGSTEITSTFGPTFVSGMPWSNGPADGGFAVTVPDIDMDCNCSPCCSDGKFYVSSISFSITMTIFIDVAKILEYNRTRTPPAPPLTLEGIYGHEQQHVMNMSFWWATEGSSQIGDALSGLGNGEFSPIISTEAGCEASCLDFKDALRSIVVTAYLSQTHTAPNPPPFPQPRVPSPPLGPTTIAPKSGFSIRRSLASVNPSANKFSQTGFSLPCYGDGNGFPNRCVSRVF
ncbi:RHS repeat-associated core domain-containing protein [Planctomycetes bacterium TBK1r]|uniref:tRNA(Glu)-specific nuclease WapA n=1 Tax=Stieleria magnilauensis TaxID=2527963 RepID=A0ABX5XZM5_9BACT|nr:tRNA(Glu)-specific nuclease WapA precursor [Planctomycetes bacterium TBK1r]